jgi:putative ABC transport system ATP-binding protein
VLLEIRDLSYRRGSGAQSFSVEIPHLDLASGELVALTGESGSGKSTALEVLGLVAEPRRCTRFLWRSAGREELDIARLWRSRNDAALAAVRAARIGFVLQTGGLLPYLTVQDNMNLCRSVLGLRPDGMVEHLADELGITPHLGKLPDALSTGERQRVAIGRAVAHRPSIVIADEPTASLDPYAAEKVMSLFLGLAEEFNITVILASHAWRHIKQLGLRRLTHRTLCDADKKLTETVVSG